MPVATKRTFGYRIHSKMVTDRQKVTVYSNDPLIIGYKSYKSSSNVSGPPNAVKFSSSKVTGDRRNATAYAAVTVYTGSVSRDYSTYVGPGWQDHIRYTGATMMSPMVSAGVFGISPYASYRDLTVPTSDVTWARSLAASNALNAEFSLLTTLAEMKSTVEGIADIASKLLRSAASLKRGRIKAALRHLGYSPHDVSILRNKARTDWTDRGKSLADTVGQAHLAYRYGINPIIYDYEALRDMWMGKSKLSHYFVVKGKTQRSSSAKSGGGENEYVVDDKYDVRFKACYRIDMAILAKLSLLGATDLLGTVWELTPYSFVIDWALNIGDFLRGLQAPLGMTYVSGHVSVKGTTTIAYTKPASNAFTKWHRPATRCEGYIRQGLGTPTVSLMFSNPFERSDNITTALALINQRMR